MDIKAKLAQAEADVEQLRTVRAEKAQAAEKAKEAFAAIKGYDMDSNEAKAAKAAVREVGETDDKIAKAQASQIELLKMLGQEEPKKAAAMAQQLNVQDLKQGDWHAKARALFDNQPEIVTMLAKQVGSKAKFGTIELGEIADRDAMVAEIGGTSAMRLGSYQGILPQIYRQLRVLDLIPSGTMDNNSFEYTQEGGTFNAAETAEGATKPEDGTTFTDATASAQTIAAWQKIRKQALDDVSALSSIISNRLRYSVQRRLEGQLLAGNGAGSNLTGILNTTGIGLVPFDDSVPLAELILTGITGVFLADAEADGIVLHPIDWQAALTQKAKYIASGAGDDAVQGGSGEYIGGGPFSVTPQVMWGKALLASPAIPQGTALVGDFAIGAQLLIRQGVNVLMSDSDQNDFIQNRITLLGEMRAALPVWRPVAFQKVALAA